MNNTSGFKDMRSSICAHQHIDSCTSDGINAEQISGSLSALTISACSS